MELLDGDLRAVPVAHIDLTVRAAPNQLAQLNAVQLVGAVCGVCAKGRWVSERYGVAMRGVRGGNTNCDVRPSRLRGVRVGEW